MPTLSSQHHFHSNVRVLESLHCNNLLTDCTLPFSQHAVNSLRAECGVLTLVKLAFVEWSRVQNGEPRVSLSSIADYRWIAIEKFITHGSWKKHVACLGGSYMGRSTEQRQTEMGLGVQTVLLLLFFKVPWVECFGIPGWRWDWHIHTQRAGFWEAPQGSYLRGT